MSVPREITDFLDAQGIPYEHHNHAPAFTAQRTAQTEHVSGKTFAKTVMVCVDNRLVMAVVPASHHVDLFALARRSRAQRVRLATEGEFQSLFPGCDLGAMPPLGNLYHRDVYVDRELNSARTITFNAGTHTDTISMRFVDFLRVVHPRVGSFSQISH